MQSEGRLRDDCSATRWTKYIWGGIRLIAINCQGEERTCLTYSILSRVGLMKPLMSHIEMPFPIEKTTFYPLSSDHLGEVFGYGVICRGQTRICLTNSIKTRVGLSKSLNISHRDAVPCLDIVQPNTYNKPRSDKNQPR